MARRRYSTRDGGYVDFTPEEETERDAEDAQAVVKNAARAARNTRISEIQASEFVTQIEDAMRNKSLAEINTFIDNMTPEQRDRAFKGLLLKWALEVK